MDLLYSVLCLFHHCSCSISPETAYFNRGLYLSKLVLDNSKIISDYCIFHLGLLNAIETIALVIF
jgi:hypothetical protein